MSTQKLKHSQDDGYVNGLPPEDQPPPWTERQRLQVKSSLFERLKEGKLKKGAEKDVTHNLGLVVDMMACMDMDF